MDTVTQYQSLDMAVCISLSTNTFVKEMNLTILPSAMDKIVRQTGLFTLGITIGLGNKKLRIQIC